MPSQIAILGWGSLLWEERPEFDEWREPKWEEHDGPSLKLEFSRVSRTRLRALTLVIDPVHGEATTVAWCLSKRRDPADAVADLRCREGCSIHHIACLDVATPSDDQLKRVGADEIAAWAQARKLDFVVWTALPSNFAEKVKKPFSVQNAIDHLKSLPPEAKVKAAEYIWRAPEWVRAPLRRAVEREPWFHETKGD